MTLEELLQQIQSQPVPTQQAPIGSQLPPLTPTQAGAQLPLRPTPQMPQAPPAPMQDPRLAALQAQYAQMTAPPPKPGFWGTLGQIGQGISTMPPAQFQQLQQEKLGQDFAMKRQKQQDVAAQIKDIQDRQRQGQQDAMTQTRFANEQELFPFQKQEAQLGVAALQKRADTAEEVKLGENDVLYRKNPDGSFTSVAAGPTKPVAPKELGHREVERGGKKYIEYYDPLSPSKTLSTVEAGTVKPEGGAPASEDLIRTALANPSFYWDLSDTEKAKVGPELQKRGFTQWTDPSKAVTRATVAQNRAYGFLSRAKQAEDILGQLGPEVAQKGLAGQIYMNNAPNVVQSQTNQSYEQAKRAFVTAYLRRDSGAVISQSEFADADRTYFPVPGDTPETLKQKAASRQAIMQGMIKEAGPALSENEGGPAATTPTMIPAHPPSRAKVGTFNPATGKVEYH